jgi:hypothetical protein
MWQVRYMIENGLDVSAKIFKDAVHSAVMNDSQVGGIAAFWGGGERVHKGVHVVALP